MVFAACDADGSNIFSRPYYSIGGGFIVAEDEMRQGFANSPAVETARVVPYSFDSANSMLQMGAASDLSIAAMKRANETTAMRGGNLMNAWTMSGR